MQSYSCHDTAVVRLFKYIYDIETRRINSSDMRSTYLWSIIVKLMYNSTKLLGYGMVDNGIMTSGMECINIGYSASARQFCDLLTERVARGQ